MTKKLIAFVGAGGSDAGCQFDIVGDAPMTIEVAALSNFWLCPSRNRGIKVGARYALRRVDSNNTGWWLFADAGMPWWSFNDDGTMSSH